MITIYDSADGTLVKRAAGVLMGPAPVWIDLLHPTKDEELGVEKMLSISIPTKDEMQEIETSSRLYHEGAAHYMTATLLRQKDDTPALRTNVTFILHEHTLVTVRYEEPRAFGVFVSRAQKKDATCNSGSAVMVGLLEAIIDREADRIERITGEVDKLGKSIFTPKGGNGSRSKRFEATIRTVGLQGEIASRARECSSPTWRANGARINLCARASKQSAAISRRSNCMSMQSRKKSSSCSTRPLA
jgi:magnesium transporter